MLVLATAAEAVVLLGDVGELEEERERSQHSALLHDRELPDCCGKRVPRSPASPDTARELTDPLLQREELRPFLLDQDAAE